MLLRTFILISFPEMKTYIIFLASLLLTCLSEKEFGQHVNDHELTKMSYGVLCDCRGGTDLLLVSSLDVLIAEIKQLIYPCSPSLTRESVTQAWDMC